MKFFPKCVKKIYDKIKENRAQKIHWQEVINILLIGGMAHCGIMMLLGSVKGFCDAWEWIDFVQLK